MAQFAVERAPATVVEPTGVSKPDVMNETGKLNGRVMRPVSHSAIPPKISPASVSIIGIAGLLGMAAMGVMIAGIVFWVQGAQVGDADKVFRGQMMFGMGLGAPLLIYPVAGSCVVGCR